VIVQQNQLNSNNKCRTDLSAQNFIGSDHGCWTSPASRASERLARDPSASPSKRRAFAFWLMNRSSAGNRREQSELKNGTAQIQAVHVSIVWHDGTEVRWQGSLTDWKSIVHNSAVE